jgi:hypothetical protein
MTSSDYINVSKNAMASGRDTRPQLGEFEHGSHKNLLLVGRHVWQATRFPARLPDLAAVGGGDEERKGRMSLQMNSEDEIPGMGWIVERKDKWELSGGEERLTVCGGSAWINFMPRGATQPCEVGTQLPLASQEIPFKMRPWCNISCTYVS